MILGQRAHDGDFDRIVNRDEMLVDANGRVVFQFIKGALRLSWETRTAWVGIETTARPSVSRRDAAGPLSVEKFRRHERFRDVESIEPINAVGTTGHVRMKTGYVLRQPMSNPVRSYLAGYGVDRFSNMARENTLTHNYPERWTACLPMVRGIDAVLRAAMPSVHERMRERCALHPTWTIEGTALSSVTVNVNYESHYHRDAGDFKDGYSALTVVEWEEYKGGLYVLPEHRVAVDVRDGDVLLSQSHVDVHGNTAITGPGRRYSFVCYLKHALGEANNRLEQRASA